MWQKRGVATVSNVSAQWCVMDKFYTLPSHSMHSTLSGRLPNTISSKLATGYLMGHSRPQNQADGTYFLSSQKEMWPFPKACGPVPISHSAIPKYRKQVLHRFYASAAQIFVAFTIALCETQPLPGAQPSVIPENI